MQVTFFVPNPQPSGAIHHCMKAFSCPEIPIKILGTVIWNTPNFGAIYLSSSPAQDNEKTTKGFIPCDLDFTHQFLLRLKFPNFLKIFFFPSIWDSLKKVTIILTFTQ